MKTERSTVYHGSIISLIRDTNVQQEDQQHQLHAYDTVHPAHTRLPFANCLCSHCFCKVFSKGLFERTVGGYGEGVR